jgi:hypothetical protein
MDDECLALARQVVTNHESFDVVVLTDEGATESFLHHFSLRPTRPVNEGEDAPAAPAIEPQVVTGPLADLKARFDTLIGAQRQAEAIVAVANKVDELADRFVARYTKTEAKAWATWLEEARAFNASTDPADAPLLSIEADVRGETIESRVAEVIAAAEITGLIPSIASGARGRAEAMIAASNGDPAVIDAVLDKLSAKGDALLAAAAQGNRAEMITLATTDWEV